MRAVIFFRGLRGQIDEMHAIDLAGHRGAVAHFYPFENWRFAVSLVELIAAKGGRYHVVGFSRGAATDVMGGFMKTVRARKLLLPVDIMTVGLYGGTKRYRDPHFECINFLDTSGQAHVGEHNAYNLGARVPHMGRGGAMQLVAELFAGGRTLAQVVGRDVEAAA